jgi:hypothetical protein
MVSGTTVTSVTSLVMNMARTKQSSINALESFRWSVIPPVIFRLIHSNIPAPEAPATIAIIQNKSASVRQLRYSRYAADGGTARHESAARTPEITRIGSLRMNDCKLSACLLLLSHPQLSRFVVS